MQAIIRRALAIAGIGFASLGILFIIISYFLLGTFVSTTQDTLNVHFDNIDAFLVVAERGTMNFSASLADSPTEALTDFNSALRNYADSAEELAGAIDGMGPLLMVTDLGDVSTKLRSSSTSLRSAATNMNEMTGSLGTLASDVSDMGAQLGDYRKEIKDSRQSLEGGFFALRMAHLMSTLAAIAGFVSIIALCTAILFDQY